jgi:KDO2-lipid IV(A) lauroyltransferase
MGHWSARRLKPALGRMVGASAVALLKLVRRGDPDRAAALFGRLARRIGPLRREHRIGRANLVAAFPEKSPQEIERILDGVWDNLGQVAAEYPHLDRLWDYRHEDPASGRIEGTPGSLERFVALRERQGPALLFAAHLANWEIPALVGPRYGVDSALLYRAPNLEHVAEEINRVRAVNMGKLIPASPTAVMEIAAELERGKKIGMLVDQHFSRGVDVVFFGRSCKANPLIARLARQFECPIHGVRNIRLPGHRFRFELSPEIEPARDAEGRIDVQGTMQAITSVIEGWVREYPDQWLWLHRRWR